MPTTPAKQKEKIDHDELGSYILKNVIAMPYITCLLSTQGLKCIPLILLVQS